MFIIIGIMLTGMLVGYLLRNKRLLWIHKIITLLIWTLLFLLGIDVGGNEAIIKGLHTLGLEAIIITLAAVTGSVLCAWGLWYLLYIRNRRKEKGDRSMKGSLIIVSFFIIGTLCGFYHLIPYDFTDSKLSYYALCGLMFCVGISIGNDPNTLKSFRSLNPRLMFLPVMTILGTLAGCAVAGIFMSQRTSLDCMAVGAGFGYYSLSSIFITEYKGPELGTIALLSNIMREIIALLGAPLLVKYFGKLAPISVGGATTMDTTLPIITRCSGKEFVIISIFHGFVVDFSVPFLVTFLCSISF